MADSWKIRNPFNSVFGEKLRQLMVRWFSLFLALMIYVSLFLFVVLPKMPLTGDEPHYLLLTHSLIFDHDLEVGNNYLHEDYLPFFPHPGIEWHAYDYHGRGEYASFHGIGLSLLLVPAYIACPASPIAAARLTLILLASLVSYHTFRLALDLWGDHRRAWLAWACVTLTSPLFWFSSQLYPDVPAALGVLVGIRILLGHRRLGAMLLLAGVIAVLPWLHTRYVILAAMLFILALVKWWRTHAPWYDIAAFLAPLSISALLFLWSYAVFYGNPLQNAQYRFFPPRVFSWAALKGQAFGLFWDRERGLIPYAPMYLLALSGWVAAVVRKERRLVPATMVLVSYCATVIWATTSLPGARSGYSLPARLMVPVIPLCALGVVYAAMLNRWILRAALVALVLSVGIAAANCSDPTALYDHEDGITRARLLWRIQGLLPSQNWAEEHLLWASQGMRHVGRLVAEEDPDGRENLVVYADPAQDAPGFVTFGLLAGGAPGPYRVSFDLRAEPVEQAAPVARIYVSTDAMRNILASRELYPADFASGETHHLQVLEFALDRYLDLEAQIYYSGQSKLWVRSVEFRRLGGPPMASSEWFAGIMSVLAMAVGFIPPAGSRRRSPKGSAACQP